MKRLIVAIDSKRGMANDHGIPWHGKIPSDVKYFRENTQNHNVLMGLVTYNEFKEPLSNRRNFVVNDTDQQIREGFEEVRDLTGFVKDFKEDLWIIGGAGVFAQTIQLADELYITQLEGEYNCTKFFPEFKDKFERVSVGESQTENGITFRFEVWRRL